MVVKNIDNFKLYKVSRKELKKLPCLKNGDVIKVGKYYIHIILNKSNNVSLHSYVNTVNSMVDLPIRKQPQYIRDFLNNI